MFKVNRNVPDVNYSIVDTLLEKKKMLESLPMDQITEQDINYYKSIIELLINLKVYEKM